MSEFQFKWNHREAADIFALVIAALVIGTAMPYAALTAHPKPDVDRKPEVESDGEPF